MLELGDSNRFTGVGAPIPGAEGLTGPWIKIIIREE